MKLMTVCGTIIELRTINKPWITKKLDNLYNSKIDFDNNWNAGVSYHIFIIWPFLKKYKFHKAKITSFDFK